MLKDLFVEELGAVSPVEPTGIGVPAGYERHNRRVQFIRGIEHASTQDLGRDLLEPQFDLVRYQYTISEKGRRSRWVGAVPVVAKDTERCRRRLVTRKKDEPTGSMLPLPLQFLAAWLAVWLGQVLQQEVDYLTAENRLLREKLGGRKLRLTDAERRRLAVLGK